MKILPIFFLTFLIISCNSNNEKVSEISKLPEKEALIPIETAKDETQKKSIIFFGNSLTAAYGLDPSQGFVALIGKRIDSLGLNYKVVNAGLSGETTAGGNTRIDWILRQKVDVFVLELGANDGLRGISPDESIKNLQSIIDKVKDKYPEAKIVLAAMEAPPNMGDEFTGKFRAMYSTLAAKNKARLIPFFLNGIAGIPELNQADGIHPTAEGHKIAAENIWKVLKEVI